MGFLSSLFGKKKATEPSNPSDNNKEQKTSALTAAVQNNLCHITILSQSDIDEIANLLEQDVSVE
ncbi:MAG: hypothetical protein LBD42_04570 [Desulfovibrio sp.]|jgi:hypothetical protein|nr:hypothetical protein [Desulfovibrio sp.]